MEHYRSLNDSMAAANVTVDNWWTRFLRRNPNIQLAVIPAIVGAFLQFCSSSAGRSTVQPSLVLGDCVKITRPGDKHARGGGGRGRAHVRRHPPGQEPQRVGALLQAGGRRQRAVVAYAGVPLARADLPAFCVPGMSVAKVRFVAVGAGLGTPESLYDSTRAWKPARAAGASCRADGTREAEEDRLLPHHVPDVPRLLLLLCQATLDGHRPPSGPSRCTAFEMV